MEQPDIQVGVSDFEELNVDVQIMPNPVAEELTVSFELEVGGMTEWVIFDVEGREVQSLMNSTLSAGKQKLSLMSQHFFWRVLFVARGRWSGECSILD